MNVQLVTASPEARPGRVVASRGRQPVTIAFIGCGKAAGIHGRCLRSLRGRARSYFASRDPRRAAEYAARFDGAGAFESYERALESPDVEAVFVTLPPALHLEWTLRALEAKKHVIVEKPAFATVGDFDRVGEASRRAGRLVYVAENYFYKPLLAEVRSALASGVVGEPRFVHLNAIKHQRTNDWRDETRLCPAGALFEGGVHWVDFAANLGLTLTEVHGMKPGPAEGLERSMLVTLRYAEGAVGTLSYSWEVPSPMRGLRVSSIFGTAGTLTFESNGLFLFARGRRNRLVFPGFRDISGYRAMHADFVDSMLTGKDPAMTLALARRDAELLETIYRTAGVGQSARRAATANEAGLSRAP